MYVYIYIYYAHMYLREGVERRTMAERVEASRIPTGANKGQLRPTVESVK